MGIWRLYYNFFFSVFAGLMVTFWFMMEGRINYRIIRLTLYIKPYWRSNEENMEWCLIQKRLAAFGYLIGKDGMLPDSEKADCLWVFDWKRWNVPSFGNKKRLAAFRCLIGKNGPLTDRTRWKYLRQSKVKLEFLHLHSRNTSYFHFEKNLQR